MFGCVCTSLCVHLNARGWYHKSVLVTFHFVFYIYLLCIWVFNKTGSDEIVPVCTRHVMSCMWRQEDNLWNSVVARKRVPGIELGLLLLFWRGFCCCFISFVLQTPLTANQNHLLFFFETRSLIEPWAHWFCHAECSSQLQTSSYYCPCHHTPTYTAPMLRLQMFASVPGVGDPNLVSHAYTTALLSAEPTPSCSWCQRYQGRNWLFSALILLTVQGHAWKSHLCHFTFSISLLISSELSEKLLQMGMSHYVGTGKRSWLLWKSSQCS